MARMYQVMGCVKDGSIYLRKKSEYTQQGSVALALTSDVPPNVPTVTESVRNI